MKPCIYGENPEECVAALGITIDGIRWDDDGTEHPYREWRPVCIDNPDSCSLRKNVEGALDEY